MVHPKLSDQDFQRLIAKCRSLPSTEDVYLVNDYVENLLETVVNFQLRVTVVKRALEHYRQHAQMSTPNFAALKNLLHAYSDTEQGNLEVAQYLWRYNLWTRVEVLRRLIAYFEAQGVTTQEQLKQWASQANFERDFKGKVKGASLAIFNWLVMRQGVETVKPDIWVHRFIQDVLGYSLSNEMAVQALENVAKEIGIKANELDLRIWRYERSRSR